MFYPISYFFSFRFSSLRHHCRFYLSLFKLNHLFAWFIIFGTPSQTRFKFFLFSIGFSSLGQHPMFSLSLFFAHLVSHHPNASQVLSFLFFYFSFLSLVHHPWFYLNCFFISLASNQWGTIVGSMKDDSFLSLVCHLCDTILGSY